MSRKIPEVVLFTSEQVKQRSEQDKRAYEESITYYTNKYIIRPVTHHNQHKLTHNNLVPNKQLKKHYRSH